MENLNDFELREKVEFEIEGKKFIYKPADANDELNWSNEYIEEDDGKLVQNLKELTLCKLRNLIEVPYSDEVIKEVIKVQKSWKDLSKEERAKFLGKLKSKMFNKIVLEINKIDSSNDDEIKKK